MWLVSGRMIIWLCWPRFTVFAEIGVPLEYCIAEGQLEWFRSLHIWSLGARLYGYMWVFSTPKINLFKYSSYLLRVFFSFLFEWEIAYLSWLPQAWIFGESDKAYLSLEKWSRAYPKQPFIIELGFLMITMRLMPYIAWIFWAYYDVVCETAVRVLHLHSADENTN